MVKFLVIRFSSIGDIVLTTPVIRCLKKQVEGAEIHYITKISFKDVLKANPYIDKLWLFDDNLDELSRRLLEENFDHVIDLHNNLRSGILKRKLKLPSFTVNKINWEKWLIVNLKINRLPDRHIVDRYMDTLHFFEVKNDNEGLDYFITEEDCKLPGDVSSSLPDRFLSLVIGAKHFTKKAPPEKLAEICDELELPVIILGGPDDQDSAGKLVELSSNTSLINLCGKLDLNQSACLVKRSELVISHDTGLMHIAAAFKKKIISIWGNTIPEFGMYPYLPGNQSRIFEVKGLSCRPCSKIGFSKCPKKHFRCMLDHDSKAIAQVANKI